MSVLSAAEQTQNELIVRGVINPPYRSEPPARDDYAASQSFSLAERVCRHIVRHRFELMPVVEMQ